MRAPLPLAPLPLAVMALLGVLLLAACGKKGPPEPPGPPDQVTYPRIYPVR
jgi:predicted small lipoprotein YifL